MELSSMLGGERFSDTPKSVCRVIGAFLRSYNDSVDDRRRQDLYRFASAAVGTSGSRDVARRRLELCAKWLERLSPAAAARLPLGRATFSRKNLVMVHEAANVAAADPSTHAAVLAFVDELIAIHPGGEVPDDPSTLVWTPAPGGVAQRRVWFAEHPRIGRGPAPRTGR